MDLKSAGTTLVTDFSHGMRKKLSLAAALLPAPKLLFLDEPFEGIDAVASRQIKDLLLSFVGRGGTIFLTSHILEIVERLAKRFALIVNGEVVCCQSVSDLERDGTTLEQLYLRYAGKPEAGNLVWLGHR
jgi:ABC-2 type transport system ATP-binding protein